MRILLMADYWAGHEIAKYLKGKSENIVGLAVHPPRMEGYLNRGYTNKIVQALGLPRNKIFDGDEIQRGTCLDDIRKLKPDIILSVFWGLLLKPELLAIPLYGCINVHLAYLPYNRGKNPNVWAIVDGTPAGVTLHYIDEGTDTGDIIAQTMIAVEPIDTGETVYNKSVHESVELFKRTWPDIRDGKPNRTEQNENKATSHLAKDLRKLDVIDLDKKYTARELINLLRARTFPPHPSAYFVDNGKKVYARVSLEYADGDR
ncbi:MAG: formyl transferase [Chloroflexi bacterium]|nr:formyl transferase [Chloroflexota bacterium]